MKRGAKLKGTLENQELHSYRKLGYYRRRETVPLSSSELQERSNREENEERRIRRNKKKYNFLQEERCETEEQ
jgi:hypothetical protein